MNIEVHLLDSTCVSFKNVDVHGDHNEEINVHGSLTLVRIDTVVAYFPSYAYWREIPAPIAAVGHDGGYAPGSVQADAYKEGFNDGYRIGPFGQQPAA